MQIDETRTSVICLVWRLGCDRASTRRLLVYYFFTSYDLCIHPSRCLSPCRSARRYCVLTDKQLSYYDRYKDAKPKGTIPITGTLLAFLIHVCQNRSISLQIDCSLFLLSFTRESVTGYAPLSVLFTMFTVFMSLSCLATTRAEIWGDGPKPFCFTIVDSNIFSLSLSLSLPSLSLASLFFIKVHLCLSHLLVIAAFLLHPQSGCDHYVLASPAGVKDARKFCMAALDQDARAVNTSSFLCGFL